MVARSCAVRRPARSWDQSVGNGPRVLEAGLPWDDTSGGVVGGGGGMEGAEGVEVQDRVAAV